MGKERIYDNIGREKIRNYLKNKSIILDLGCNKQKIRKDADGWDINFGDVKIDLNNLDNYNEIISIKKEYYEGISMSHILEHIIDTRKILSICKTLLNKGGKIAIIIPDGEMVCSDTLGDSKNTHEMLFTSKTLKLYLENIGFKNVKTEYYNRPYAYKKIKGIFGCGEK